MLRKIISLTFILLIFCQTVFAHTAEIENSGAGRYKSVRLTPEIYNNANSDLSDLRLRDDKGEDLPYFIRGGPTINLENVSESYSMSLINAYSKDDEFYFDYRLASKPGGDIIATSLKFWTDDAGFAKNISLYGSYDNRNWDFIKNDTLYNVDGRQKLEIFFGKEQKFTHYRVKLGNNLEKISFSEARLIYSADTRSEAYFSQTLEPDFSVETRGRETEITIKKTKNLRLAYVTIETDSMFKREVSAPFGTGKELYNLTFGETNYSDTTLLFGGNIIPGDELVLTVHNGDDKPININKITMAYYADDLIFEDNGSAVYALDFEANGGKTAPVYDIARYKDEILKGAIDSLEIKEVTFKSPAPAPESYDYQMVFNITVVAVAIILGLVILFRLRRKA